MISSPDLVLAVQGQKNGDLGPRSLLAVILENKFKSKPKKLQYINRMETTYIVLL